MNFNWKNMFLKILIISIILLILIGIYQTFKPLPKGVSFAGKIHHINQDEISFIYDLTYLNIENTRISDQKIFDEVFSMIDNAEEYILIDWFLYNDFIKKDTKPIRTLATELTNKLIAKKINNPNIKIDFITDKINTLYGTRKTTQLKKLENSGINVIYTKLSPLRDSNIIYSSIWRAYIQWFGIGNKGIFPHIFSSSEENITLRSYLKLLNFKANHRKLIVTDDDVSFVSLITSANPHDGSSAHSNVAVKLKGALARDIYDSENFIANMSNRELSASSINSLTKSSISKDIKVQLLTESKIKDKLLTDISNTINGDLISIGMFYLSDNDVLNNLIKASERNVIIKLILDPNKDAFGYTKNGIPNRQVAHKLLKNKNISLKWYQTHGEQYHSKLIFIEKSNGNSILMLGSANYTRRNLDNYNLETNIWISANSNAKIMINTHNYFNKIWNNEDGKIYTTNYTSFKDVSKFKILIYKIQESLGLSTF